MSERLFRTKICGVTSIEQAQLVGGSGVDAIGLNFCKESRRYLHAEVAIAVADSIPASTQSVGVFVNSSVDQIRETAERLQLDFVQLHGDESLEFAAGLEGLGVLKVVRCGTQSVEEVIGQVRRMEQVPTIRGVLLDAFSEDAFGGTGKKINWSMVPEISQKTAVPLILAGGLTPHNVSDAIRTARPAAVDTASGVESSPATKSAELCRLFVEQARLAFDG